MAGFMENLWNAIFEAGPTPTLLLATNATFAALQALLFALLIATYSIHFVILSTLCAGLWFSINWFAAELRNVQMQQKQERTQQEEPEHLNTDSSDAISTTSALKHQHLASVNVSQPAKTTGASIVDAQEHARARFKDEIHASTDTSFDSDWEKVER